MGITFIKLGQYLAIRRDVFGDTICSELSQLFGNVAPMSPEQVAEVIEGELGHEWRSRFRHFDWNPLAAASIAQVHRGETRDGDLVAIKVQRPDVPPTLATDLRLLGRLARAADAIGLLGETSARDLVEEMADFIRRELDFMEEARSAERMRADRVPGLIVPRVRFDLTTPRVLTMELIEGHTLLEICRSAESGDPDAFETLVGDIDLTVTVERLAHACFYQIFVTGRFHGDPHPANVIIQRDGGVAFVDFGVVSEFDAEMRRRFGTYVRNVALGDVLDAFWSLSRLVRPGPLTDIPHYRRDAVDIMERWYASSRLRTGDVSDKLVARYQAEMFDAMRRNHIEMPKSQLLFWRALAQVDSIAHRLPVEFDLLDAMRRFFTRQRPDTGKELSAATLAAVEAAAFAAAAGIPENLARRFHQHDERASLLLSFDEEAELGRSRNAIAQGVALVLVAISIALPVSVIAWSADETLVSMTATCTVLLGLFGSLVGGVWW